MGPACLRLRAPKVSVFLKDSGGPETLRSVRCPRPFHHKGPTKCLSYHLKSGPPEGGSPLETQLSAGLLRVGVIPAVAANGQPLVGGSRVDFQQRRIPVEPHCRARKGGRAEPQLQGCSQLLWEELSKAVRSPGSLLRSRRDVEGWPRQPWSARTQQFNVVIKAASWQDCGRLGSPRRHCRQEGQALAGQGESQDP